MAFESIGAVNGYHILTIRLYQSKKKKKVMDGRRESECNPLINGAEGQK